MPKRCEKILRKKHRVKIGIVGLGLIGGSLAMAGTRAGHEIYGFDVDTDVINSALQQKIIVDSKNISQLSQSCDLIVLCVPSRTASEIVEEALQGTALVTDVSSVKKPICDVVAKLDPEKVNRFIGGHPMAGSEQSGLDAARENMFQQKMWIVVPPENSSLENINTIETFISSLGAEHCILSPEQHDALVAYISHLPQIASSALMDLAAGEAIDNEIILRLAGGGFRDMTRIASNNITMWNDIVADNSYEIAQALDAYINTLTSLKESIENESLGDVTSLFQRARSARGSLPDVARRLEHLSEILVPVPDEPGVLAKITQLSEDINIYDIRIVHALEDDRGVLSLIVDPDVAQAFVQRIHDAGFEASVNDIAGK
jgi:prephenate dehydrogenase